jgi:hypothetical protein
MERSEEPTIYLRVGRLCVVGWSKILPNGTHRYDYQLGCHMEPHESWQSVLNSHPHDLQRIALEIESILESVRNDEFSLDDGPAVH